MPQKERDPAWRDFERRVADVFRLYGFFVSTNVIIAGRQVDILLESAEEFLAPIVVECKYHSPDSRWQVGVEEVEAFAAFVLRLRSSGTAQAGYLITNSGFTAAASGALRDRPEGTFVFLRTIEELLRKIVKFDGYLTRGIEQFERDPLCHIYEPVNVRRLKKEEPQPFDEAVDSFLAASDTPTLLVLGDYGTGKTSSSKHLFYRLAKRIKQGDGGRIPLYIPLKTYNYTGSAESLINKFLIENLSLSRPTFEVFDALNSAGLLFLILDGFDEMARRVTPRVREEAFRSLGSLVKHNSKVVITGRPGYFPIHSELLSAVTALHSRSALDLLSGQLGETLDSGHRVLITTVQSLTDHQIVSFLERRLKYSGTDQRIAAEKSKSIVGTIKSVYNLNELARRPILLEMIFRTFDRMGLGKIRTATDLYKLYTDTWLTIEIEKGDFRTLLSGEDRLYFALKLAWAMFVDGKDKIHFTKVMEAVRGHFNLLEAEDVDYVSSDVRTCAFLERSDDGFYAFAHKSFMEFFVARAVSAQLGCERIAVEFEETEVTLCDLEERIPNIFSFLDDLAGLPMSPKFWSALGAELENYPELIDYAPESENWLQIIQDISKESTVAELQYGLTEVREAYQGILRAVNSKPNEYRALGMILRNSRHEPLRPDRNSRSRNPTRESRVGTRK